MAGTQDRANPELPAGIMPDYRREIPEELACRQGTWVEHQMVQPGVICHVALDGTKLLTVRIILPPNGLLSSATLRRLAAWIRTYALTGRRTSRQGFELVGVDPDRLPELLAQLSRAGFIAGGTGKALHQIKCCTSFVHCQNAAVDAPSIAQALADHFYADFLRFELPAPLKISVGGCPNQCGGGVEADIGILGQFEAVPEVDEEKLLAANIDTGLLLSWCPSGAIQPRVTGLGTSVTIDPNLCVRCTSCVQVAPEGIGIRERRYVAIAIGGHGGNSRRGPEMAAVVFPQVDCKLPDYPEIIARVEAIIELWRAQAQPGERLHTLVERMGWNRFLAAIGGGPVEELLDSRSPKASLRRDLHFHY